MTTRTHLTLRDRRILAGLGKPRDAVATPYVNRAQIDAIVNTEHARALKRQHAAERAGVSPELTMRQALHQRYRRALRTVGGDEYADDYDDQVRVCVYCMYACMRVCVYACA